MKAKRYIRQVGLLLSLALLLTIGVARLNAQELSSLSAQTDTSTIQPPQPVGAAARAAVAPHVWTAAEMKAAIPYPVKSPAQAPTANQAQPALGSSKPQIIAGQAAENEAKANSVSSDGSTDAMADPEVAALANGPTTLGYSYPYPFTRYEVFTAYNANPYNKIGKLFFKQGGLSYVCSASSIGNRGIITAGHCIHAGNNSASSWSTNVVFVPAYKDGAAPYGQWACDYVTETVFTAWYQSHSFNRDVAGCKTINQSGKTLSAKVGSLGFAWNFGNDVHWFAFGYPAASPFTGNRLITCAASRATWDMTNVSPATQGVGCDMTGGSSGGPWVLAFSGSGGYVNGVNSYKYTTQSGGMFSPYFDDVVKTAIYDNITKP
ncbi:MAG TPA: hypothetical protein PKK78_19240 [Kouleothrix sp.]|nr:hypothetical protein [Kouleothrix sp.]